MPTVSQEETELSAHAGRDMREIHLSTVSSIRVPNPPAEPMLNVPPAEQELFANVFRVTQEIHLQDAG
jgi:hypothetical protein